jgi:hypothetical protein
VEWLCPVRIAWIAAWPVELSKSLIFGLIGNATGNPDIKHDNVKFSKVFMTITTI